MKSSVYLASADRYSAIIKSEIRYIKVTIVMFIEQRNLRSLALHFSKAPQEPCWNSSLLTGVNGRDTTNRTGCTQLYSYGVWGRVVLHDTHNEERDTGEPKISSCKAISLILWHNDSVSLIREYRTNNNSFIGILLFLFFFVSNSFMLSKKTNDWIRIYLIWLYNTFAWKGPRGDM